MEVEFRLTAPILSGLEEIGRYLKVSRRTAWRWVHEIGLPAAQTPAGTWITSTSLIDQWILVLSQLQWEARQAQKGKASAEAEGGAGTPGEV